MISTRVAAASSTTGLAASVASLAHMLELRTRHQITAVAAVLAVLAMLYIWRYEPDAAT